VEAGLEVRGYDQGPAHHDLPSGLVAFTGDASIPNAAMQGVDLVVLSPGVPPGAPRRMAGELAPDATIHGELSLALEVDGWDPIPTVLITGTNGKSTVTAMLGAVLRENGKNPFVGGNFGPPLSELALDIARDRGPRPDALVLECSSYQLETTRSGATEVAMVLNVTPDHLDRYRSLEDYAETKGRIFSGLRPGGLALLSARDLHTPKLRRVVPESVAIVEVDGADPPRVTESTVELPGATLDRSRLGVAGRHNAQNALFAWLAARQLGIDDATSIRALTGFTALPHRMNPVRELAGVMYYDDSKATNVASVCASLDGFDRPYVLIAGGRRKGDDLDPLRRLLSERCRALIAIGESAESFEALAAGAVPTARAGDLAEAVELARGFARPGDAIVLSPACASFDMFENYAARGQAFRSAVEALDEPPDRA
jgi:UDP-N-acetylmuramoylalanine--D-glutamate ligase